MSKWAVALAFRKHVDVLIGKCGVSGSRLDKRTVFVLGRGH